MKSYGIIYKATNLVNGKIYVGQTIKPLRKRISGHLCEAHLRADNTFFHNAIRKYGLKNFDWNIVYECKTREELNIMETFAIITYRSHFSGGGYNLTFGGDGCNGRVLSPETRRKISLSHLGKTLSEEHKMKIGKGGKGKKHTDEAKEKMRRKAVERERVRAGRRHMEGKKDV